MAYLPRVLAGLAFCTTGVLVNRFLNIEIAFGISLMFGNVFGILAALVLPPPFGALGPFITMLPTIVLWGHPGALASVLIEGILITLLIKRGKSSAILMFEPLYWLFAGAPLVFVQYRFFLGFSSSSALAAAAKQGANAAAVAMIAILGYQFVAPLIRTARAGTFRRKAREYILLFLNFVLFLPLIFGATFIAKSQAKATLGSAEAETSMVSTLIRDEIALGGATDHVRALLEATGHQAALISQDGSLNWSYPETYRYRIMTSPETIITPPLPEETSKAIVVVDRTETNPMRRWRNSVLRATFPAQDGGIILVEHSFAAGIDAFANSMTLVFAVGMVWLSLASAAAYAVASILVNPLERLRKTAEAMQGGEIAPEWPESSIMEIHELRDSLVALTGSLSHREMELSEAKATAEELSRKSVHYLAFMGHELKAPLAALGSTIDELLEEPELFDTFLTTAQNSVRRLVTLIDDILDQARARSGRIKLRKEPFSPASEARNLLEPFAIQARRLGLDFSVETNELAEDIVSGDAVRFRQILANLTSNAIKYTKTGFVAVRLSGERTRDQVVITGLVEDSGAGIDPQRFGEIWEPFASGEASYAGGMSSHGLGLSIVRGIVDSMNGTIGVSSAPGQGTTFMFTVGFSNASQEPAGQAVDDIKAPDPDLRGIHALIADDERISCMVLSRLLKRWGAQVEEVWNGTKADERCAETVHELVILDENMPGCSGTQVARAIREREKNGTPAYIILSSGDTEAGAALIGGLVDATLPKPFEPETLRSLLLARFPVQLGQ